MSLDIETCPVQILQDEPGDHPLGGGDVRAVPALAPQLRRLLVVGATSVTRRAGTNVTRTGAWVRSLLECKPTRLATVAIANKTASTAWALLVKGENYRAEQAT